MAHVSEGIRYECSCGKVWTVRKDSHIGCSCGNQIDWIRAQRLMVVKNATVSCPHCHRGIEISVDAGSDRNFVSEKPPKSQKSKVS